MSKETMEYLNRNILRGFTDKRGKAWHHREDLQGTEANHYPGAIPLDDIRRRLFNWQAIPVRLFKDGGLDYGLMEEKDNVAWCRDDTMETLSVQSATWSGHQYAETLIDATGRILSSDLNPANAGLLRNGAQAFVQVEMPENIQTAEGVTFRPFLLATTAFDGSISSTWKTGYTDVVCDNTRECFLAESGDVYRVRHTSKSQLAIADAKAAFNIIERVTESITREVRELCAIDVTDSEWSAFVEAHAPIDPSDDSRGGKSKATRAGNLRSRLTEMWNTDPRVSPWRGTAWGVVQAVNTFEHWDKTVKVVSRAERNFSRAVQGGIGNVDKATLLTLSAAMGRELIPA